MSSIIPKDKIKQKFKPNFAKDSIWIVRPNYRDKENSHWVCSKCGCNSFHLRDDSPNDYMFYLAVVCANCHVKDVWEFG